MKTLCIYHGNCADGFTSAWVVRKRYGEYAVDYYPGVYNTDPPDVVGRDVIMVDFCYQPQVMARILDECKSLLLIDHHITAIKNMERFAQHPKLTTYFGLDKSGAGLTWEWFYGNAISPNLVDYVQDRDLWKFSLMDSRAINAFIFSFPYEFAVWDEIARTDIGDMALQGRAIDRKHLKDIAELLNVNRRMMRIGGYKVPVANMPYTMASDAAGKMSEGYPFAACYWDTADSRQYSLRSGETGLDVSLIAQKYHGGGHKHAAGFRVGLDAVPQIEEHGGLW